MKKRHQTCFGLGWYLLAIALTALVMLLCVCAGSVSLPIGESADVLLRLITGRAQDSAGMAAKIILPVRLPRVLCVALVGALLSLCGACMQGLLRNPLADGSTLGVNSGASLGAVIAIASGFTLPGFPFAGTMVLAILFAFGSLVFVMALVYSLDQSLSTNTIILLGVIFSMFASSISNFIITFAGEKVKTITFWTLGSLQGSSYQNALVLAVTLVLCCAALLTHTRELNAFAISEDNARSIGVDVRRVKLLVLIVVSAAIGVCVSISGNIGFVGLVTPHMLRRIVGPNHRRLLPACVFGGAIFLMFADLTARVALRPRELPIGVITSFVGSIVFVFIYCRSRRKGAVL